MSTNNELANNNQNINLPENENPSSFDIGNFQLTSLTLNRFNYSSKFP